MSITLGPNQLHRFYRGGPAIAAFRGIANADEYAPEDWVGSTTTLFGADGEGLSRLPDGRVLRDALAADPGGWLGPEHVERFGADPAILVKLLDAGERLPVHCHPDRAFAARELGRPVGKTEAWMVVDPGVVHVGFREEVDADVLAGWVASQQTDELLGALNELAVEAGDTVFVPGRVPHAIGEGVFIVEVQEPSDLSILLEWESFPLEGEAEGHLGLGFPLALQAVDRSAWTPERLEGLRAGRGETRRGVQTLLPPAADEFFRAERIHGGAELEPAFSILVGLAGEGTVGGATLRRGTTLLVPYSAGSSRVDGDVDAIRCLPPGEGS